MNKIAFGLLFISQIMFSQIEIRNTVNSNIDYFELSIPGQITQIYVDTSDFKPVKKVAELFSKDIGLVTGKDAEIITEPENARGNIVIVGTIGNNEFINELLKKDKYFPKIEGQWKIFVKKTKYNLLK